jgi:putative tricarboxylic transport membrane protein
MDSVQGLILGFSTALQPINIFYCFLGALIGTFVGVLPGLGPTAAMALLLPTTYYLNPVSAMIMLAGILYGAMYGSSTTAILLNIPGEAASVTTCLDGYQMARQGRAGVALGVSAVGSFIAGTFAVMALAFLAPPLAKSALKFGPPEYFCLMLMALTIITYMARVSMIKGLMMAALGLILSTVGMDPVNATPRFAYGISSLYDGLGLPAVLMGLFGISEVLENIGQYVKGEIYEGKIKNFLGTGEDWKRSASPIARGTLIGFFMGIFPGVGSIVPTIISYAVEKKMSKHPEKFGTGMIEGVAGPEAANNAAAGGTFIPLMSLGIPGTASSAMLLAALMILGLRPGPLLIKESPDVFWGVVSSMYLGNVMLLVLNLPLIPIWIKVLKIPYDYLFSMILLFCLIGAYSVSNNTADVIVMVTFGIIGYLIRGFKYELAPFILAYVLGPIMEPAFRRSLIISKGSFGIFVSRPISAAFLCIAIAAVVIPLFTKKGGGVGLPPEEL